MSRDEELSIPLLEQIFRAYLSTDRSVPIKDIQEQQGNSSLWEKELEDFLRSQPFGDFQRGQNPDFGTPYNFDLKMVRADRPAKTFTFSDLTPDQAETGVLPYRTVVLLWRFNDREGRGYPYEALVIPREARSVLTNWSYGIQAKSGISEALIRSQGVLSGQGGKPWVLFSPAPPATSRKKDERFPLKETEPCGPVPTIGLRSSEPIRSIVQLQMTSDTSAQISASICSSETTQRRNLLTMKIPRKLAPLADVTGELGRYNFQCVHIEKEGDRALAVATDGTAMVAASWPTSEEVTPRDVEGQAFKTEAKIAGAKKEETFELPPATTREASFPPFRTISKEVPTVGMRIELDALITALDALKSLAKGKGRGSLQVDLYAPLTAGNLIEIRVEKDEIRATASIATVPIGTPYPATFEKAKAECEKAKTECASVSPSS